VDSFSVVVSPVNSRTLCDSFILKAVFAIRSQTMPAIVHQAGWERSGSKLKEKPSPRTLDCNVNGARAAQV
jgi:hypothetical protein